MYVCYMVGNLIRRKPNTGRSAVGKPRPFERSSQEVAYQSSYYFYVHTYTHIYVYIYIYKYIYTYLYTLKYHVVFSRGLGFLRLSCPDVSDLPTVKPACPLPPGLDAAKDAWSEMGSVRALRPVSGVPCPTYTYRPDRFLVFEGEAWRIARNPPFVAREIVEFEPHMLSVFIG